MIENIILENFKCFKHIEVELSNLNIFAGINGMGKSTVIQSLLLLRQTYELNAIEGGLFLNGKYVQIGTGKDLLCKNSDADFVSIRLNTDKSELKFKYSYDEISDFQKAFDGSFDISESQRDINLFSPTFSYVSADRIGPRRFYESSYHEIFDNNNVGSNGEFFADYLARRGNIDRVSNKNVMHENGKSELLLNQTNAWLSEISPDMQISVDEDQKTGVVSLSFSNEFYSPKNVGFGLSYLAPIIVSLLKAKSGDLVIIENPEAHIHPKGQRIMGELIAKVAAGGVQIIVETHSDHILNGLRLSVKRNVIKREATRLNFFYREKTNNKVYPYEYKKMSPAILDNGELSDWPDGFFDEWDKTLMELL